MGLLEVPEPALEHRIELADDGLQATSAREFQGQVSHVISAIAL